MRCTFFIRRHLCFRLGRPAAQSPTLPGRLHIPFRRQPANISRRPSFHTGPHNPKPANSIPPGLAGRRLTFLPTTFLTSTKHHLPTKYRSPPFFHSSSFFYFLYRRQHPSGLRLSVPTSHHFPNALHFFRPAAASPTRRPNAKRSFARGCSLQGCRWCGRGARVSFFFFLFFIFFCFSLFSLLSHLPGAAASPRRLHFSFCFSSYFCLLFLLFFLFFSFYFSFCFFLFIFLLIFYSCFFFVFSF